MQTIIHPTLQSRPEIQEADDILRKCVHCGFCTATCPTYQLLGDELDGPRGRIYLIKSMLEENDISAKSVDHLNRCLTCRACETSCPSGVAYGRLLDIGRGLISESFQPRGRPSDLRRNLIGWTLRQLITRRWLFDPLLKSAQWMRSMLPKFVAHHIPRSVPSATNAPAWQPLKSPSLNIILLQGCVQKSATPNVNKAIEYLLSEHNVQTHYLSEEGCCGALDYHLAAHEAGIKRMKTLLDRLYDRLHAVDYIVSSASGCGVTIKEYAELLKHEAAYAEKAARVCEKVVDIAELLARFKFQCDGKAVAVHTPCTLQHGQKLPAQIENFLLKCGAKLTAHKDKHLCCGAAGTYSILEPTLSSALAAQKITALTEHHPDFIVTANVGCQIHLDSALEHRHKTGSATRVIHWVEYLAQQHQASKK